MAADEIGGGQVIVTGDGVQRQLEAGRHVGDKAGLAAAGRALDQQRQALVEGVLEERDFITGGFVEGQIVIGHGGYGRRGKVDKIGRLS